MDRHNKQKHKSNSWIFLLFICLCTVFMSIGYAKINSITSEITGTLLAEAQDGIFITDITYGSNLDADTTGSKIVQVYQNIINSNIVLSETNAESYITYNVSIYNKLDTVYRFKGVTYDSEFYSNENITFELLGLQIGDRILSENSLTFSIKFKYIDSVNMEEENFNNVLNSVLNFDFERDATPVLANKMVPVYYESGEWKKTVSSSNNWHDYYNRKWANSVTYNNNLVYNQVKNNTDQKVFNGTSDYIYLGSENYNFGKSITVIARVKLYSGSLGVSNGIVGNLQSAGFYLFKSKDDKFAFEIYDTSIKEYKVVSSTITPELNTWYTVVGTYDGSKIKLYINGSLDSTVAFSSTIPVSEAPVVIGGNPKVDGTISSGYFKGAISEAIVMTETLTESEIAKNYSSTINHTPTNHTVLYYLKFNGDNGIVCNSASYEEEGMLFDGVDDYISIGYSSYDFNNTFSIGARVKLYSHSDKEYGIIGNPQSAGIYLLKSNENKFQIIAYDNSSSSYKKVSSTFVPELDTWYTVVATYDGTTLKLYIDGELNNSSKVAINIKNSNIPFMLGVNPTINSKLGGGYWDGMISDVILVDEALTANQISINYSSNVRNVVSDKTLISYDFRAYEARENGTTIPDEMINTMWVWIPRFSTTIPNSSGIIDTEIVGLEESAHDSFTFGEDELEGFWIGKFENSTNFISEESDNNVYIKANKNSWTNSSIGSMFNTIKNIALLPDIYGINTSNESLLDTHLIKSNEWGAVAYLAQSKYGNTSSEESSTTGNEYGVYQMTGGVNEFVMGNYNNTTNSYFETLPESKYYNIYTTQEQYTNNKLQHALFETNDIFNTSTMDFVDSTNIWIVRNGLFSYNNSEGDANSSVGSRSVLTVK